MDGHRDRRGPFGGGTSGQKGKTGSRERVTSALSIYCHIGFSLCLYLYFLLLTVLVLYHLDNYIFANEFN